MKALEWENYCYFYLLLKQLAQLFIYFILSIVHSPWIQFEHMFSDSVIPIEQIVQNIWLLILTGWISAK